MAQSVPIRRWRIANLKSIERADLELAPLTVIVGANSSGKSTVLQSMLLAVQAAQARTAGGVFPLNGPLAQLGEYADVHSAFAPGRRTSIGGRFDIGTGPDGGAVAGEWQIELAGRVASQPGSARLVSVALELSDGGEGRTRRRRVSIRARGQERGGTKRPAPPVVVRGAAAMPAGAAGRVAWPGTVTHDARRTTRTEGLQLVAGFPTHYLVRADEHDELAESWLTQLTAQLGDGGTRRRRGVYLDPSAASLIEEMAGDAAADIRAWLDRQAVAQSRQAAPDFPSMRRWVRVRTARRVRAVLANPESTDALRSSIAQRLGPGGAILRPIEIDATALEPLRVLAERMSYLGPLRQEPQVVYRTLSTLQPRFLGTKGEYLAPVLHRLRDESVSVPTPDGTVETLRLHQALDAWLVHLEAAASIESHDAGRLGYDLRVTLPDLPRPVDLTSIGVGVSQVVPVIVVCLLAEPGSVILLEQPELHLHPAMQQRLADFLLAIARAGRQVIIETHSEYLVTRLRLRMAQDATDRTAALVTVINASKRAGRTRFDPVEVNRYGSIEEWPDGFFDQASADARELLEAGLAKADGIG